jgi:hypothetical protein
MSMKNREGAWAASINWTLAALSIAALGFCVYVRNREAEYALRTYGHTMDSGAYVLFLALLLCIPAALLFTLAGTAWWRQWRARWILQVLALASMLVEVNFILKL